MLDVTPMMHCFARASGGKCSGLGRLRAVFSLQFSFNSQQRMYFGFALLSVADELTQKCATRK